MYLNNKGFTFIISTIIIISLISMLLISARNTPKISTLGSELNKNYKNEFLKISTDSNINLEKVDAFNKSFKNYIKSHNYNTEICSIINDGNNIYISNYLGKDCELYIDGSINQIVSDNSSIKIESFINNTNIYLCTCTYNNKDIYYIKTYNSNNQIINKNTR